MKILWCFAFLHAVFVQANFGSSYLGNSKLCQQWSCLNTKLGLPDALPDKNHFRAVLNSLLPEGPWQNVAGKVVDTCFGKRPRTYTNTCPGQGLLFCAVDQLIENCPEDSLRKDDACAPLTSIAGFRYLFSQSRYKDLEKNLPTERRPKWFLKNYFSTKCCDLPKLLKSSVLNECGFTAMMSYYDHPPRPAFPIVFKSTIPMTTERGENKLKIVDISMFAKETTTPKLGVTKVKGSEYAGYQDIDPLDCCNMDEFIQPAWRSDCDFHLQWSIPKRIMVKNVTRSEPEMTSTTTPKPKVNDVKVIPISCEKETCVFSKLGIVSSNGSVDIDAFSKLLDNVTDFHADWSKAKARVVTTCLARRTTDYSSECDINKVLTCTLDVLSENCPHAKKTDPCNFREWNGDQTTCRGGLFRTVTNYDGYLSDIIFVLRRTKVSQDGVTCQVSASRFRPKNRRLFCGVPNLVNHEVLSQCGVTSISRMEYVPVDTTKKTSWLYMQQNCQEPEPTKCVLNKMGALNKYGFMDYFRMKDRIRNFTSQNVWAALTDVYLNAFAAQPLYYGYCHTSKKLLNVVDFMLSTCPMSKRKLTHQCNKIFTEMATTSPFTQINKDKLENTWRHFQHVFLPHGPTNNPNSQHNMTTNTHNQPRSLKKSTKNDKVVKIYDQILNSNTGPAVQTMAIRPQVIYKKPLVLYPVYLRGRGTDSLSIRSNKEGVIRSPFELHEKIVAAHTSTTTENVVDTK